MKKPQSLSLPNESDCGLLFVHGFTGSTDDLQEMAHYFHALGYHVELPLLPGHGVEKFNFKKITENDWFTCIENVYLELQKKCTDVFLIGLSMGAILSFKLARKYPKIKGVIAMATPYWLRSPTHHRILGFVNFFHIYRILPVSELPKQSINPKHKHSLDRFEYPSYPIYGLRSLYRLIHQVLKDIPYIKQPVYLMHSTLDAAVPYESMEKLANLFPEKPQLLTLEKSGHVLSCGEEKRIVIEETKRFIEGYRG